MFYVLVLYGGDDDDGNNIDCNIVFHSVKSEKCSLSLTHLD